VGATRCSARPLDTSYTRIRANLDVAAFACHQAIKRSCRLEAQTTGLLRAITYLGVDIQHQLTMYERVPHSPPGSKSACASIVRYTNALRAGSSCLKHGLNGFASAPIHTKTRNEEGPRLPHGKLSPAITADVMRMS